MLRQALTRFRDEESGAMLIFGLFMLVAMLICAGFSIDVARFEMMRSKLQNTLDTATLAAANLNQSLDPKSVVEDYMDKAGLGKFVTSVNVTSSLNSRTVTADASARVPTAFLRLVGVDDMTPTTVSTASESIGNVEISLVLDNSGSMSDYNKIGNLKSAATQFVSTMFKSTTPGKLSISIVPYAAQVTLGPDLFSYYNINKVHDYSYCVDFQPSDFQTAALGTTEALRQAGNFDPWYNYLGASTIDTYGLRVCPKQPSRYILPFSGSQTALDTEISNLYAAGNTSIDVGMKWGAALLDPSAQPIVTGMIAKGELPADFAGRPYNYRSNSLKVIVVMTDGSNTSRPVLNPAYASGPSQVWSNSSDSNDFSFYDASRNQYFWTYDGNWHSQPYGDGASYQQCTSNWWSRKQKCKDYTYPGTAIQMTWPQVWENMTIYWFLNNIISPAYGYYATYSWDNTLVSGVAAHGQSEDTQDTQMLNVCSAAKANGVLIYSIGFMADAAGQQVLQDCATRPGYYYNVQNLDIASAFASIANSINTLRLTQ